MVFCWNQCISGCSNWNVPDICHGFWWAPREDSLLREEEADEEEKPPDPEEEVPVEARSPDATTSSSWLSTGKHVDLMLSM